MPVRLLTFDIFGTVVDWRRGLAEAIGRPLLDEEFDRVIDHQGRAEQGAYRRYRALGAESFAEVLKLDAAQADAIAAALGSWPLCPDAAAAIAPLPPRTRT